MLKRGETASGWVLVEPRREIRFWEALHYVACSQWKRTRKCKHNLWKGPPELWEWEWTHLIPWLRWQRIHLQCRRPGFDHWVGKFPWRRAWKPTPIFLPGESPWTEEPVGYSPGSQSVRHDWTTKHGTNCRIWHLTNVFIPAKLLKQVWYEYFYYSKKFACVSSQPSPYHSLPAFNTTWPLVCFLSL